MKNLKLNKHQVSLQLKCKIHFLIELNDNNIISSLEDIREEIIKEANTIIANYNQEYVSVYYINDKIEIEKTDIIRQKLHSYTYKNIYTEDEKIIKERQIAAIDRKVGTLEEKLIKKCAELANNLRECSEQKKAIEEHINSNALDKFKNFNKKKINDIREKINKISNERDELLK